jgi:DNA-binding MarR family transcriptional regulator
MRRTKRSHAASPQENGSRTSSMALDFKDYVPAHLTFLANKISSGASAVYRPRFGVGITEWRIMALLAREAWVSPRWVSEATGLDKGAVSRSIQSLREAGHVEVRPDQYDRRSQILALTPKGLALHDRIVQLARKREQKLLSGFSSEERALLTQFLARMESQVPAANALAEEPESGQ